MRSSSEEKLLCLTEQIDIFVLLYQSIQNCLSLRKPSLTIVFKPSINLKINKLIYLHMHLHLFISKKNYFRQIWFRALMFILKKYEKMLCTKATISLHEANVGYYTESTSILHASLRSPRSIWWQVNQAHLNLVLGYINKENSRRTNFKSAQWHSDRFQIASYTRFAF